MDKKNQPIGVFDSGLGGLTVVKELTRCLPFEDIVYYGDTARVPYGTKSRESILQFSKENTEILIRHNVKMVIVACNTSSSYALTLLKEEFNLPILGVIAPGIRRALKITQNKRVGVIATSATIKSESYARRIFEADPKVKVVSSACPLFVPVVESGWGNKKIASDIAYEYLKPLIKARIDTLILGCTHYPLLKTTLKKVMGKKVHLVDSAKELASEVKNILEKLNWQQMARRKPQYYFLVSDEPQDFKKIAMRFLKTKIAIDFKKYIPKVNTEFVKELEAAHV